jgi:uncharacterized protein YabN with tetrapyrrole methylase and pyrophosphatase domain
MQRLSPLQQTLYLERQAQEIGFKWETPQQILDQIISEVREVQEVLECESGHRQRLEEETGDMLMAVMCFCFFMEMDPENILAQANEKFAKRFASMREVMDERQLTTFEGIAPSDIFKDLGSSKGQNLTSLLSLLRKKKIRHTKHNVLKRSKPKE